MPDKELKPCPFCGGQATIKDHGQGTGGWMISCRNMNNSPDKNSCGVLMVCPSDYTARTPNEIQENAKQRSITAWNTRQPDTALVEALEKMIPLFKKWNAATLCKAEKIAIKALAKHKEKE